MPDRPRIEGKIKHVNKFNGWGFITSQDVPFEKIFFYWEWLNQNTKKFLNLEEGDLVSFELNQKDDGSYQAFHIDVIDKSSGMKEASVEKIK